MPDQETSLWEVSPAAVSDAVTANPSVTHQETTVNLADGASIDFVFNIDSNPIFDMFVRGDQALIVRVFVRQSSTDTFAQLGADYAVPASHPNVNQPLAALRLPGSQAQIRLLNSSGAATTVMSAQVHARSL